MNDKKMTISQFARLHDVNKRTLHYYDEIGLFSPNTKSENGYRLYDFRQNIDFEYIQMLKELRMRIDEIRAYQCHPNADALLSILTQKQTEVEAAIRKLKETQNVLESLKRRLSFCDQLLHSTIEVRTLPAMRLCVLPFHYDQNDIEQVYALAKENWSSAQIRMGMGEYIRVDKIMARDWQTYDGIYSIALDDAPDHECVSLPEGPYVFACHKGDWNELPSFYERILSFVKANRLTLGTNAYEFGLNEFAIASMDEYMTCIFIPILHEKNHD